MKLVKVSDAARRLAVLMRQAEQDGRVPVLALGYLSWAAAARADKINRDAAADSFRICGACRSWAFSRTGVDIQRCERASELLERWAELVDLKWDKVRDQQQALSELTQIARAMVAWARVHAGRNLLKDRRLNGVPTGGGRIKNV